MKRRISADPAQSRELLSFQAVLLCLAVFVLGGATRAAAQDGTVDCDWQRGDLHKMHWPQAPDCSEMGVEVNLTGVILADDFKCAATGAIRDIHLWGAFLNDQLPQGGPESLTFELRIYSDIPAERDRWSRPGTLLWKRTFEPNDYTVSTVHYGPTSWYDVATDALQANLYGRVFQYDFCVDEEPFVQEEGTVYWLALREVCPCDEYPLGWKATAPRFHWNDDAVYFDFENLDWLELTYPKDHRYAGRTLDLAFVITSGDEAPPESDLGDAPDSSNSWPGVTMTAYTPAVTANFPTVYREGSPPYGPRHLYPRDLLHLGRWVSLENEADLGPDEDPRNNLVEILWGGYRDAFDVFGNHDGADDGLELPLVMPHCRETTLDYTVTVNAAIADLQLAYVNVWCDWNRDGDWDDTTVCPDGEVIPEWAVQNQGIFLSGPSVQTFTTPAFKCWHPARDELDPLWLRITLAEKASESVPGAVAAGGSGPEGGYKYGETEDYYLRPGIELTPLEYDWADAPNDVNGTGYPTLMADDGARHIIAGPWFGDANDRPDAEADGQPDLDATGDDINAGSDENGVSIPPLVPGQPAAITVQISGGGGVVEAWIDFDNNQAWYDDEQIYHSYLPDGIHVIPLTVPEDVAIGQSFARFRISRRGGLDPVGPALDGEVEDHEVWIHRPPANVKWCQWPDLTPYGIDIRADRLDEHRRVLADDFECTDTSRLTQVRFWGSWKNDRKGQIKKLRLRIYADDPIGIEGTDKENKYSKPSPATLWEMEFVPAQIEEELYHVVSIGGEWWWDPNTGESSPAGDTEVWQIDVKIDPNEAFLQTGTADDPQIYWLAIDVETVDGQFGWKTRHWPRHFMDDAVWNVENVTPNRWRELRYPQGHRFYDHEKNSIDMAFCLMFTPDSGGPVTCMPACVTQCPAVATACPTTITQCPTMETACPAVQTQCPLTATACPPVSTQCPAVVTQCRYVDTQCPALETRCPAVETQCPSYQTRCPSVETKCPAVVTRCPPVETQCPATVTDCRQVVTECPAVETRCPPVETKCPAVQTECPSVSTQCPSSVTQCPVYETRCPSTETKCPSVQTQCPPVETLCPAIETECPSLRTHCPVSQTACPAVETRCPVTATKCPVTETRCPTVKTQCPVVETECPSVLTKCPRCIGMLSKTEADEALLVRQCPVVETPCLTVGQYLAMTKMAP